MHIYLIDTAELSEAQLEIMEKALPASRRQVFWGMKFEVSVRESLAASWLALGALGRGDINGGLTVCNAARLPFFNDGVKKASNEFGWPVGRFGKPFSDGVQRKGVCIYASVSHSSGLAAAAIDLVPIGLDVQCISNRSPQTMLRIAERFHANEYAVLSEIFKRSPAELPREFSRLWAIKECVLKLAGTGIAGGLDSFFVGSDNTCVLNGRLVTINTNEALGAVIASARWTV